MTVPPFLAFPRSECTSCRHVPGPKNGSPTRPEMVHNGSVTRPSENVANGGNGARAAYFSPCPRHLPRSRTRLPGGDMSSERADPAARMAADPTALEAVRSLAALFDVLERAGGGAARRAHRAPPPAATAPPVRAPAGSAPFRCVRSGLRPWPGRFPGAAPAPRRRRCPPRPRPHRDPLGRTLGRRSQGEYLAWRPRALPARPAAPRPAPTARRRSRLLRHLVRRIALWGAGPRRRVPRVGCPRPPGAKRAADRPVVLREMPSTPRSSPSRLPPPRRCPSPIRRLPDRGGCRRSPWSSGRPRRKTARTP